MVKKYDGSLLNEVEKRLLAKNLVMTDHSKMRLSERCPDLDVVNAILESKLVYWNQYGYIVVALPNEYSMIVAHDYALVTVREPSNHHYTNADRWLLTKWRASVGRRCYR